MRALVPAAFALTIAACSKDRTATAIDASAAVASAAAAMEGSISDHDAEGLVRNTCLSCHSAEMIAQQRLTPAQWSRTVTKMVEWGAMLEPKDVGPLVAWLGRKYAVDAGTWDPVLVSADQAAAAIAPLPDGPFAGGDAERGRTAYADRCSGCHGADAKGHIGVNLRDRPFLFRADAFASTILRGRGKMLPMRMSDPEIGDLLAYLRTLPTR